MSLGGSRLGWRLRRRGCAFAGTTSRVLISRARRSTTLRGTGCLFVISAVESADDAVLEKLDKGHTRADFG